MRTARAQTSRAEALPLELPRVGAVTVGLISGGLGAYWPQFPELRPRLVRSAATVARRLDELAPGSVVDVGLVSDAEEATRAGERLRGLDCDLVVVFCATYLTASMVVPIAQRSGAPVLLLNLQPTPAIDDASRMSTGDWLAYCGACPLPEIVSALRRCGVRARSVSGYLDDDRAWSRVAGWLGAARARHALRGRHGLLGHLYPGMLDVSTDPTLVVSQFGGHVEVLEIDDLRVRVEQVSGSDVTGRVGLVRSVFDLDDSVGAEDLEWAARVSLGMDRLVEDFSLDSLAYYHRGLGGDVNERIAAGMIVGASLLTARGLPAAGEYELRTVLAMLVLDRLGAGGSFTEIQALDFDAGVVEMGHDGPAHLAISQARPLLRGLDRYHGKRGWGVSVELAVRLGEVTTLGLGQEPDGRFGLVVSEGHTVDGPLLRIGNTTSRVDFGCGPGEWTDAWSASGVGHHWALGAGHRRHELEAVGDLLGIEVVSVQPA